MESQDCQFGVAKQRNVAPCHSAVQTNLQRPSVLRVIADGIPNQLKKLDQWCCWRYICMPKRNGKFKYTKVPFQTNGRRASTSDRRTWCSYEEAIKALQLSEKEGRSFDGVGFIFTDADDLIGIDIDDCRDTVTGELSPLAQEVLNKVDGYAEISPSGSGVKIFTQSKIDRAMADHSIGLEIYTSGRYFAVTGSVIEGHDSIPDEIQDLSEIIGKYFAAKKANKTNVPKGDVLSQYKLPINDWGIERIKRELMPNLFCYDSYHDWVKVGMALHHQFQGTEEGLALWDEWSSQSEKYAPECCLEKWTSFSKQRLRGEGAVTLSTLIKLAREADKIKRVEKHRTGFNLVPVRDLIAYPPDVAYLIDPIIETNTLGIFVGESQTYKSFCAIDVAASIATGTLWHGRDTLQGSVIYIAGEGHKGLGLRAKAWEIDRGVPLANAPLYFSNASISMMDAQSMKAVTEAVEAITVEHGLPKLIVIDTVHRNFGDGDENATQDWAVVFQHLDALRVRFNCAILLVHHTGHTAGKRARGSSALRAGVDFEFLFQRTDEGEVKVECMKAKDSEPPSAMGFEPITVALPWRDRKGNQHTSLVLSEIKPPRSRPKKLSRAQLIAFEALQQILKTVTTEARDGILPRRWADETDWRAAAIEAGISDADDPDSKSRTFRRAKKQLLKDGLVACVNERYTTIN
jgi:hypothetical protein